VLGAPYSQLQRALSLVSGKEGGSKRDWLSVAWMGHGGQEAAEGRTVRKDHDMMTTKQRHKF
jgi:hypothetical protein